MGLVGLPGLSSCRIVMVSDCDGVEGSDKDKVVTVEGPQQRVRDSPRRVCRNQGLMSDMIGSEARERV